MYDICYIQYNKCFGLILIINQFVYTLYTVYYYDLHCNVVYRLATTATMIQNIHVPFTYIYISQQISLPFEQNKGYKKSYKSFRYTFIVYKLG